MGLVPDTKHVTWIAKTSGPFGYVPRPGIAELPICLTSDRSRYPPLTVSTGIANKRSPPLTACATDTSVSVKSLVGELPPNYVPATVITSHGE